MSGGDFTPLTPDEREELIVAALDTVPASSLRIHLFAQLVLCEMPDVDPDTIFRGIAESPDAGVAMAGEVLVDMPEERREILQKAVGRALAEGAMQAVLQLEHACRQLRVDAREVITAEAVALVAATPAVLAGVRLKPKKYNHPEGG